MEGAGTAGATTDERTSNLWSILPSFDPAVDDPREYVDKVKFLRAICPVKDKGMLAPPSSHAHERYRMGTDQGIRCCSSF